VWTTGEPGPVPGPWWPDKKPPPELVNDALRGVDEPE
jgi:hypothetical protein